MAVRVVPGNLPAEVTSFIGRERELKEVKALLAGSRLVTLTGAGGTGKTRLATRAAAAVRRAFPDGTWFVDLTEVRRPGRAAGECEDPQVLAFLVAAALGLQDWGRPLIEHLAGRQALLVVDNCEHQLPACAVLVERLLRGCPGLRVLTTSRAPLAVPGEVVFPVPALPVPDSVTLFVTRARAAVPTFEPAGGSAAAIAEICRRLDGLPLAIELAAARVRVLGPDDILDRLADRFTLLGRAGRARPVRQQTLRACMDWSFELCAKPEQLLWTRLTAFVGGFELDAVEDVCADDRLPAAGLLDVVAGLVDKSIMMSDLVADSAGERARYRMLETVRAYGREQAGDHDTLRRRHRDWCRRLVDRAAAEWISDRQGHWHARLAREHANLRAAVEYSLATAGEAEVALHLTVNVPGPYWFDRGVLSEFQRWMRAALEQATAPTAARARALILMANNLLLLGDGDGATRLLDEGETLARALGATAELALAAYQRGVIQLYGGDLPTAIDLLETSLTLLSAAPAPGLSATVPGSELEQRLGQLVTLGIACAMAGRPGRAAACADEVLAITEPRGERHYRSFAWWVRAAAAWSQGRTADTMTSLAESLRLKRARGVPDQYGTARCIEAAAWVAAARGQHRRAAVLLGAAEARWTDAGTPIGSLGHLSGDHDRCERLSRDDLGDAAFRSAFGSGRALSYEDAIAYALGERSARQAPVPAQPGGLTRRERQVADLLGEGLSNREIAARLVVSQRTAESHVEHILAKLGFTSRAQVAAWVAAHRA